MEERFAQLDGNRIYYQSTGSANKAILFLPGWGCDHSLWRNQVPELVAHARVLCADMPGHGRSDAPDISYTLPLFERSVGAVLDDAGLEKAAVAGHSMGAMVAYDFARKHPERTSALIWVDGAFGLPIHVEMQLAQFRERAEAFRLPDYRDKLGAFIDSLFVPETPAAVRDEVRQSILATPQHVLAGSQAGLADPQLFAPSVLDLPAFAVFSAFWNPGQFAGMFQQYLPRLGYQIISGVGHYPMLEKPAEVTAALIGFLEKIGG